MFSTWGLFCPQGERILSHSVPFYLWELLWFLFLATNGSLLLKQFSFRTSFQLMTHFHLGMTFSWYYITFPFTSVKSCLPHLHHIYADEYASMLPTILNFNKAVLVVFLSLWIDLKGLTWLFPLSVTSLTCLSIVSLSTSRYFYVFIAFYYFLIFPDHFIGWSRYWIFGYIKIYTLTCISGFKSQVPSSWFLLCIYARYHFMLGF